MSDTYAFGLVAWGGVALAVGTLVQTLLASNERATGRDPLRGWPRVFSSSALVIGGIMNAIGALHFTGID